MVLRNEERMLVYWNMNITGLNIIFLSPVSLSGRKDVTSDNVNFRPDIKQNFLEKKKKKKKRQQKKSAKSTKDNRLSSAKL